MNKSPELDIPEQFETARLIIRCPQPGDGAIVHASVKESLAELRRFPASLPWAMEEPTVEGVEEFCRWSQSRYRSREALPFLVFARNTGAHVGNVGLSDFEWQVPKCEVGFWGRTSSGGQGVISEAVLGLAHFAFKLGVVRVYALPDAKNARSCRVCERAGFTLEGTVRHDHRAPDGTLRSARIYAKISGA